MWLVLFTIKGIRYGLNARDVLVVVADRECRPLPGAPSGVVGLMMHDGKPIPVIDVGEAITGVPAERKLSTRIVIVPYKPAGPDARIGLRLARANDAARVEASAFSEIGVSAPDTPCLGPVADLGGGWLVQLVEVERLLTPAIRASLQPSSVPEVIA